MAWSVTDLEKLQAAVSSGVRSVTFADGRRTEYQSLDHVLAAIKVVDAELRMQAQATNGLVRRRVPYYRSGL
ncbi:phage head-tail joining protein [Sphingomonas hylomeconis]|uniref:Phage head-tail joining protein n=1 Tax=Sphingomonas hylomeconis TaxID=1395958 RepID=A0ABV7SSP2_9SPHN|nr:hypothetical protein [Sphingomonas hylomeconis]